MRAHFVRAESRPPGSLWAETGSELSKLIFFRSCQRVLAGSAEGFFWSRKRRDIAHSDHPPKRITKKALRLAPPGVVDPPHPPPPPTYLLRVHLGSCADRPSGCPAVPLCGLLTLAVRVSNPHKGPAARKHREHIRTLGGLVLWEFKDTQGNRVG